MVGFWIEGLSTWGQFWRMESRARQGLGLWAGSCDGAELLARGGRTPGLGAGS